MVCMNNGDDLCTLFSNIGSINVASLNAVQLQMMIGQDDMIMQCTQGAVKQGNHLMLLLNCYS